MQNPSKRKLLSTLKWKPLYNSEGQGQTFQHFPWTDAFGEALLRLIYMTDNFWHGSDKNGTRTSFTRLFLCRAKRCEITFWCG